MKINLHIERLVLDGTLLGDERAADVRTTLQRELERLLAAPGAIESLRSLGAVEALPPVWLSDARHAPNGLGMQIAAAVNRGFGVRPALTVHDHVNPRSSRG